MLRIYKASAGSGKTFQLTISFLELLLINSNNYKHLLAVTFTNKAANELKERIVKQLFELTNLKNLTNPYALPLSQKLALTPAQIATRAQTALEKILQNYSQLSISTLDGFTQKTIRQFNHELELNSTYAVEVNEQLLQQTTVQRLLNKALTNQNLRTWLLQLCNQRIQEGKNYNITQLLTQVYQSFLTEQVQQLVQNKNLFATSAVQNYIYNINTLLSTNETNWIKIGQQALQTIEKAHATIDNFKLGTKGPAGYLHKLAHSIFSTPNATTLAAAEDIDKWLNKAELKNNQLVNLVTESLQPSLKQVINQLPSYTTAQLLKTELHLCGLLADLIAEYNQLCQEQNILPITATNKLLQNIINNYDAPFIYEKIGSRYTHIMIDEFQDTSLMQWNNFKPLIHNALAEGNTCFIVGDAKQAIYRWRNGNWSILTDEVYNDCKQFNITTEPLQQNYRSTQTLVNFNNLFFEALCNYCDNVAQQNHTPATQSSIQKIYYQANQTSKYTSSSPIPQIAINFLETSPTQSFTDESMQKLLEQIISLQNNGVAPNNIAILTRKRSEIKEIANFLLQQQTLQNINANYSLQFISNEALALENSPAVRYLINWLQLIVNYHQPIVKASLLKIYTTELAPNTHILFEQLEKTFNSLLLNQWTQIQNWHANMPIKQFLTRVIQEFNTRYPQQSNYINTFADAALQLTNTTLSTNHITAILSWWQQKGSNTAIALASSNNNAMQLMTIHQSKGLEFEAVLIPFCNWELGFAAHQPMLWCIPPQIEPFNQLPLVPIKAKKEALNSYFQSDYLHEYYNAHIDNLNLTYVAFTRAKTFLYINSLPSTNQGNHINHALHHILQTDTQLQNKFNQQKLQFNW